MNHKQHSSFYNYLFSALITLFLSSWSIQSQSNDEALKKINKLESLMNKARKKSFDVTREETALWFSKEFLKFAHWDESHKEQIEKLFGYFWIYKEDKKKLADELPGFERKKVIEMLDQSIANLEDVIDKKIVRKPVAKVDWGNIEVAEDTFLSNGKPIFLYDYFSKSVGRPLTDTSVYNDHLGNIYHGGSTLYEVNQDRAINPFILNEDGTFDEEKLKLITDIPDTNVGFFILWNMGMPEWIHKKDPQVTKGRSLFTGFDIDNPLMRDVWSKVITKAAELTKGKKVTQMGYILSNEPHYYSAKGNWTEKFQEMTSLSTYTMAKFRTWLNTKYNGNIEALNRNWSKSFSDFDSVEIEMLIDKAHQGKPMWYDWCRYNMDRSTDWFTFLQKELHKTNPDADTSIKLMPNLFTDNVRSHGIDVESLTELTTMIGDDAKTSERNVWSKNPEEWEEKYIYYWEEMSVSYDFLESVAPNKIHFNSESHYLSSSNWRKLDTSNDYVRSTYWLATIQGMDANLSWFWARDPDGSPEDRLEGELNFFDPALAGSYAGSVNMQPNVANEYTQVMMDLNTYSEEIMALRNQRRPIRLFYSETSAINKKFHMSEQFPMYESLYFEGFPMGYATEKIIKKQDHSNWDVLLVYKTEYVTDAEFDAIQMYLNKGGTVLLDGTKSLSKNEYGETRKTTLKQANGKLIKMEGDTAAVSDLKQKALDLISNTLPEIVLTEDNGTAHKGCFWRVAKNPKGGHFVTIVNIGKNSADLKISKKSKDKFRCTNMLTGQSVGADLKIKPMGVFLLEVQ